MSTGYFWVLILAAYQVAIILAPHPEQIRRPWLRALVQLLGRLSLFRHQAGPRTLHVPLTRQPWWSPLELERLLGQVRLEELRQGPRQPAAPDEGRAPLPRRAPQMIAWLQPAAVLLLVLGLAGCARNAIDAARIQYKNALTASTKIQGRFKIMDARYQLDVAKPPRTREQALAALLAYREKRRLVSAEILRCQSIMDEAAEQLLLSDQKAGIASAAAAQTCAAAMRAKVNALFDGGL